jgi:hypothetical protein
MVNFKKLTEKAREVVDKRGGTGALKEDMEELGGIAKGKGSLKDKAKAAGDALKDPGAPGREHPGDPQAAPRQVARQPAGVRPGGAPLARRNSRQVRPRRTHGRRCPPVRISSLSAAPPAPTPGRAGARPGPQSRRVVGPYFVPARVLALRSSEVRAGELGQALP